MQPIRLPRFKRVAEVSLIELTPRDREIIRQVHRHRFLRSSHITALIGESPQRILRRLQLLFHHGYLERPRAQIEYYHRGGSRRIVYGLGSKGAALLKREHGVEFHPSEWGVKNRSIARLFLEHALLASDVMVAIELACREAGHVRLITGDELMPSDQNGRKRDLIDQILGVIPANRITDVVLVDPSDEEYSVGFNILSAHSDLEKNLLASDLVSVFQRLSTSWGDQLNSVLQNAILAFLESDEGGTLADVQRFLLEPAYRDRFLNTVRDPSVVYYWRKGFTQLSGNKSIGPVVTRLGTFLSPKPIRYMVSQKANRLDFGQIIDTGKIFLAKLPQGQMGKENAFLLGSLLVSKFQQLAMSRQAQKVAARKDFWLYIDEFQNFITPSMTEILTGARKYRLGLILAHQELRQLERDREVASAVLS